MTRRRYLYNRLNYRYFRCEDNLKQKVWKDGGSGYYLPKGMVICISKTRTYIHTHAHALKSHSSALRDPFSSMIPQFNGTMGNNSVLNQQKKKKKKRRRDKLSRVNLIMKKEMTIKKRWSNSSSKFGMIF